MAGAHGIRTHQEPDSRPHGALEKRKGAADLAIGRPGAFLEPIQPIGCREATSRSNPHSRCVQLYLGPESSNFRADREGHRLVERLRLIRSNHQESAVRAKMQHAGPVFGPRRRSSANDPAVLVTLEVRRWRCRSSARRAARSSPFPCNSRESEPVAVSVSRSSSSAFRPRPLCRCQRPPCDHVPQHRLDHQPRPRSTPSRRIITSLPRPGMTKTE
jgi:hypothetical protein